VLEECLKYKYFDWSADVNSDCSK